MAHLAQVGAGGVEPEQSGLTFTVLTAIRAWRDGAELDLGSPQQRLALAVLLLADGQVVPIADMIAAMWDGEAPPAARGTVRTYVHRLRRVLGADESGEPVLRSAGGGYRLRLAEGRVDLSRLRNALRAADTVDDVERRAESLRAALDEWTARPLAGVEGAWAEGERRRAVRLGVQAVESLAELELGRGGHAAVLERLRQVVELEPLHERAHELLMRALHQAGRREEALAVHERLRVTLREEMGVEPGPGLQALYRRMARSDAPPRPSGAPAPATALKQVLPTQLPLPLAVFTGRELELRDLDSRLAGVPAPPAVVVHGTAGVGKTTFVVQWANRIAPLFPDGQLYVNLRGFDANGVTREPADVLRELLDGLGLPKPGRPDGQDGLAALYRSAVADRRVLVVLDNARDSGQVLPLLPGSPGCLAVVTSRSELTGLVASTGAHTMKMRMLDMSESVALMTRRLGERRVATDPVAVRSIAKACAHLPLALAVASARIATNPALNLSEVSHELTHHAEQGLDFLAADDPRSDVRSVLSWSYQALSAAAARAFRLLSVVPLSQAGTGAIASLIAQPLPRAQALMRELAAVGLVVENRPGRYSWHDLLREYSAELLDEIDDADVRWAARRRLLDHHLVLTRDATVRLSSVQDLPDLPEPAPGVSPRPVADHRSALEVFATEHDTLTALVELAEQFGFEEHGWRIAWHLRFYQDWNGQWASMMRINQIALRGAERTGDHLGIGHARRCLARVASRTGRTELALHHLDVALDALSSSQDRRAQAYAHLQLSGDLVSTNQVDLGLAHVARARALFHEAGPRAAECTVLMIIAFAKMTSGAYREVIELVNKIPDHDDGTTSVVQLSLGLDLLAEAHACLDEHEQAAAATEREIELLSGLEVADGPHTAFLSDMISLSMFVLARSLYLADRPERAVAVQREAYSRLRAFIGANFRNNRVLWDPRGHQPQRLLDSIDALLGENRPAATWFLESIRVFDATISALEDIGIVTDLIRVRDRNRSIWNDRQDP
ncbi:BTAD domain-containing putative transcriptional regulator [Lentzea sp. NBRC 102530]|uniref:AfsR/SARP family transcriptional regulator n=1 Tax=Lentzea sp. NBRC 102530 TaxID=3032201 RepID=UPI0024A3984D|nr:BTAD domain-containing putative transcriptional regulator [Lentzea sp. NBRC 102530]GLY50815.1 SARP family transcriptional regulator [Lentzea sp. NBRC 102530]